VLFTERERDQPVDQLVNFSGILPSCRFINYTDNFGNTYRNPDIILRADNIIANAYGAVSSPVSTVLNPGGYDSTAGRSYTDNPLDPSTTILRAVGFNAVDDGEPLVFDIRGVSPALVSAIGRNINERNYYEQPVSPQISGFENPSPSSGNLNSFLFLIQYSFFLK